MNTLYQRLPKGKQNLIERYQFSPRYKNVKLILESKLMVSDMTIFEADDVYQLLFHDNLDMDKLFDIFKQN